MSYKKLDEIQQVPEVEQRHKLHASSVSATDTRIKYGRSPPPVDSCVPGQYRIRDIRAVKRSCSACPTRNPWTRRRHVQRPRRTAPVHHGPAGRRLLSFRDHLGSALPQYTPLRSTTSYFRILYPDQITLAAQSPNTRTVDRGKMHDERESQIPVPDPRVALAPSEPCTRAVGAGSPSFLGHY
jgi:hypothetical protein